jgi:peptidyl-prolyl cis-trans isomerase D
MVEAFSDTCFFSEIGEVKLVTSPQTGFHIVEVTDKGRKVKKAQVAILARKVDPSSETYNNIYNKASRFAGKHRTYDEFIEGINEEDLTKKVANNIQRNAKQIAGLENARKLIRAAFETKEKEIIKSKEDNQPIFEIGDQFVIAFVTEARKDGIAPFDEVKEDIKVKVKENKKAEKLAEKMKKAASQKGSLDAVASELGLQLQTASNITYSSFNIRGAGAEPKLVGTALAMEPNKISAPVKGENGVYLIEVTSRQENNNISPDMIKQREIQGLTRTATYEVYNALKEAAEIQDKRYKFY